MICLFSDQRLEAATQDKPAEEGDPTESTDDDYSDHSSDESSERNYQYSTSGSLPSSRLPSSPSTSSEGSRQPFSSSEDLSDEEYPGEASGGNSYSTTGMTNPHGE